MLSTCDREKTSSSESEGNSSSNDKKAELKDVKVVLNWFAKAQHGGVYSVQK